MTLCLNLLTFAKSPPVIQRIIVEEPEVEQVDHCTLLGVLIASNLSWVDHCQKILKKAKTKLFFRKPLKRAKVPLECDIIATFLAVVWLVLEYACQVWHPGLTMEQHDALEKIQERELRMYDPGIP